MTLETFFFSTESLENINKLFLLFIICVAVVVVVVVASKFYVVVVFLYNQI